jgi:PAS domain S-box-containing protein
MENGNREFDEEAKLKDELWIARSRYQSLFDQASDIIMITDKKGNFTEVSSSLCNLFEYTKEELLNANISKIMNPDQLQKDPIRFDLLTAGQSVLRERSMMTRRGKIITVEVNAKMLPEGMILAIARDVTERKIAEEKSRKTEMDFRVLVEQASDGIFISSLDGHIIDVNNYGCKLMGYSHEELRGMCIPDLFFEKDIEASPLKYEEVIAGNSVLMERKIRRKDGTGTEVETNTKMLSDKRILAIMRDITERKRVEHILRESENKFRNIVEKAPLAIACYNDKRDSVFSNQKFTELTGYSIGEVPTADIFRNLVFQDEKYREWVYQTWTVNNAARIEVELKSKSGEIKSIEATKAVHNDLTFVIANDLTERIKAERKLQRAYERLNYHINNTPLAVVERDRDLKIIQWNKRAEEIYGWKEEEVLGRQTIDFLVHEEDKKKALQVFENFKKGILEKKQTTNKYYTKDGNIVFCQWYHSLVKDEKGHVETILSLIRDVTEIRKAEEAILISEEKYRQMFYKSPYPAWIYDMDTLKILEVNDAAVKKYGYNKKEFSNLGLEDLADEKDFPALLELINHRNRKDKNQRQFWNFKKSNAESIVAEVAFYPINYFGKQAMQVQLNDVTERIRLEKKLHQQEKLKQLQITEAVLVAQENERSELGKELHDNINQLLAVSKIFISTALDKKQPARDLLIKSMENLSLAIEEIRNLSKKLITPELKEIGLKESIIDLAALISIANAVKISLDIKKLDESTITKDRKIAVYRIIQEQLNNIIKYAGASSAVIHANSKGEQITLIVSDNGKGFDPKTRRQGIGFTNILSRAELYNGTVNIDSAPGKGCRLEVILNTKVLHPH